MTKCHNPSVKKKLKWFQVLTIREHKQYCYLKIIQNIARPVIRIKAVIRMITSSAWTDWTLAAQAQHVGATSPEPNATEHKKALPSR